MRAVTVSPKFQVVIPKDVRESMGIISGQKIQMLTYCNRIELIPIRPMSEMKGFLKGIDTEVPRDKDRICRRAMLPHEILGLLSPTFIRLRSEWEMPWSPCVRLNYAQNPAPLRLPQMAERLFGMQFLPPSRATSALRIRELPCRLPGTKNHHSA
ncbi:hypothetical protein BMR03_09465 [Methylococcaceae bacterium HT2]|nr:hypothetical protein BMR06_11140 [Methylococcaceae bacterium HT5]TXL22235.1 hypothetical protein BMR03_09450 [Methylococcaceae bacterium HT2]TXL22237.1 hypothetical protein BMR03_09465 [Methylococcaceae bacterium HT2]